MTKEIKVGTNRIALVDDEDASRVLAYRWYLSKVGHKSDTVCADLYLFRHSAIPPHPLDFLLRLRVDRIIHAWTRDAESLTMA